MTDIPHDATSTTTTAEIQTDLNLKRQDFQQQLDQLRTKLDEFGEEFLAMLQAQKNEADAYAKRNDELQSSNAELQQRLDVNHGVLEKRESDIVDLHSQITRAQKAREEIEASKADIVKELEASKNYSEQLSMQIADLQLRIDSLKTRETELLKEQEDEQISCKTITDKLKEEVTDKTSQITDLQKENQARIVEKDELQAAHDKLAKIIAEKTAQAEKGAAENKKLQATLDEATQTIEELSEEPKKAETIVAETIARLKVDISDALESTQQDIKKSHVEALNLLSTITSDPKSVQENPELCAKLRETTRAALNNNHKLSLLETYVDPKYQNYINAVFDKIQHRKAGHSDTIIKCFSHFDKGGHIDDYACNVVLTMKDSSDYICGIDTQTLKEALTHEIANSAAIDYAALVKDIIDDYTTPLPANEEVA